MIRMTLERYSLFQAFKNVGSIIPLILSIHTFVLALIIPGMFEKKVFLEYKHKLVQISYIKKLEKNDNILTEKEVNDIKKNVENSIKDEIKNERKEN